MWQGKKRWPFSSLKSSSLEILSYFYAVNKLKFPLGPRQNSMWISVRS